MSTFPEPTSSCNWIVATSWPTYLKACTKKNMQRPFSNTKFDDSDTQQTELETENLGEIYPAIITPLNDLSGPKAAKFTGPRGKKTPSNTSHLQRTRIFWFNKPVSDP